MKLVSALLIGITVFLSSMSLFEVETSHACENGVAVLLQDDSDASKAYGFTSKEVSQSEINIQHACHIGHCAFLLVIQEKGLFKAYASKANSILKPRVYFTLQSELLRPPSIS